MNTPRLIVYVLALAGACHGAEFFVDQQASPGGDGSANKPFQTINQAVKASAGGDVITVSPGMYTEKIHLDKSGTADRPTTLRAASTSGGRGRVIISGFEPVIGWQRDHDQMYATTIDGAVEDLFVGYVMQPVARWPGADQPWRMIGRCDAASGTITDRAAMGPVEALKKVAADPMASRAYLYASRGNFFRDAAVSKLDPAAGTITTTGLRLDAFEGEGSRYHLINHPALISAPGQWAAVPLEDQRTRLYFRPADPADLQHTQIRRADREMIRVGPYGKSTAAHFRLEGLEVTGSLGKGIAVERAEHVTVTRCVIHHNESSGLGARRSGNLTFTNNIVVANGSGITMASSQDVLVEQNEIALNFVDGLVVAGNISGKPDGEPTTADVMVRRNYIHHHMLLSHPDNMQTYRGVQRLTLEDNLLLWGGQGLMSEETDHGTIRNCIFFGTGAVAVIFGHANSNDWTVTGTTIGLGGWGALSLTGKNYHLDHNIYYHNATPLGDTVASDYNLFDKADADDAVAIVSKPKWRKFTTIDQVAAATGQERHSIIAPADFRAAPARQAIATWHLDNTIGRVFVRQSGARRPTEGFAAGDRIEINGDGVLRRITAVDDQSLRFDPPLPQLPLRSALVWNWRQAKDAWLDLRPTPASAALKDQPRGATLDIAAYQRGDFDADGKRDLPELPDDVKAGVPNPNDVALPLHGS